jgi:adenylate cyclase
MRGAFMNKKILIADDEDMITKLCKRSLTGEGYDVVTVNSGKKAVEAASLDAFDMIVTDMLMPGMNGVETFLALRERHHDIIGVLITGHGTMDLAIEAMGHGFSGFVRKPFAARELIQVVNEAFQKAALMEENTRLRTLIPLFSLGEKFMASFSEQEIFHELIETISNQMGANRISIMIYDEKEDSLKISAARGFKESIMPEVRIRPGEKIAGRVFSTGEPLIINGGPEENPVFSGLLQSRRIAAAISYPLRAKDRMLGVLNISKMENGSLFTSSDIEMLSIVCGQAVMALENLRVMEEKTEKMRMRTLLEQYVSPEVANILISHGRDLMDIGEKKRITVLFADIRNFTPLVQSMPLESLRAFLNQFFNLLSEIIFKNNGTLDKFMGDALLAFFGAPITIGNPEASAVTAAMMMHEKFRGLKEEWTGGNGAIDQIGLGVGISAGELFLGNVGSHKRFDFTVLGVDVNIAQRLAMEAKSGEILITNGVKYELDGKFHVRDESSRMLKGINAPVSVYSVEKKGRQNGG